VGRGGAQILQLRIIDSVKGNTHHVEHRSLNLVITVDLLIFRSPSMYCSLVLIVLLLFLVKLVYLFLSFEDAPPSFF
jgi:hypothetical protein